MRDRCVRSRARRGGAARPDPATPGDGRVVLGWRGNTEPDLFYYKAYRATAPGGPYTALPSTVLSAPLQTVRSIHSTSRRQSRTTATTKAANGITIAAEFGHLVGGPVDAGAVR